MNYAWAEFSNIFIIIFACKLKDTSCENPDVQLCTLCTLALSWGEHLSVLFYVFTLYTINAADISKCESLTCNTFKGHIFIFARVQHIGGATLETMLQAWAESSATSSKTMLVLACG